MIACGFCADEFCWVMDGACDCECHAEDPKQETDDDCLGCGQCKDCIAICIANDPSAQPAPQRQEPKP